MAIHPGFQPLFEAMQPFLELDWATTPVEQLRAYADNPVALGDPVAMARVEEIGIPVAGTQLAARLYVPETQGHAPPLTVFFHGGGWMLGTLETHDATCRSLARGSGSAVLSVAYRLAPEHRYPIAAEDCYAATQWAAANGSQLGVDASRLAVAGDSAGGNLAAATTLMARDRGGPHLAVQLLIYPATNHACETKSYKRHGGSGNFLTAEAMRRFWSEYLGDSRPDEAPLAAILRRSDFGGLPPAIVALAECDVLHDEGEAYARQLEQAGVPVCLIDAPGMIHGFFGMTDFVPEAAHWARVAAVELGRALKT